MEVAIVGEFYLNGARRDRISEEEDWAWKVAGEEAERK
jgi:hypothetical protein